MSNTLEVTVKRIDDKVKYLGTANNNPPIQIDYPAPLGTGEGYTSLELLLISLASCSASSIIAILKKRDNLITDFNVKAKGERKTQHPTCFSNIRLEFNLTSSNTTEEDLVKAIQFSESTLCPVWAMLKGNVVIEYSYKINR
ncbi:MAG: OsmC family protein [bacterium]